MAHVTQDTTFNFMTPRLRQFANKKMPPHRGYVALGLLLCGPGFRAALPRGLQIAVQHTHKIHRIMCIVNCNQRIVCVYTPGTHGCIVSISIDS